jgi:hypothetical protein
MFLKKFTLVVILLSLISCTLIKDVPSSSETTISSPEISDADLTITGTVKDVSISAKMITLQKPLNLGIMTLALIDGCELVGSDQSEIALQEIQPGMQITVSGQNGNENLLLADHVVVYEREVPTIAPTTIQSAVTDEQDESDRMQISKDVVSETEVPSVTTTAINDNDTAAGQQNEANSSINQDEIPENVLPVVTPSSPQGYLVFPYQSADAGNFSLQAGEDIQITWKQAPQGANSYEFVFIRANDGVSLTIGVDHDFSNGVEGTMNVSAHLSGQLVGIARFGDDDQIWSLSSTVYAGELPPDDVCSLQANGVGVVDIYLDPEIDSPRFAYLIPGTYATVLKRIDNDWYLIDASVAIDSTTNAAAEGEGWVNAINSSFSLHGSCEEIQNG